MHFFYNGGWASLAKCWKWKGQWESALKEFTSLRNDAAENITSLKRSWDRFTVGSRDKEGIHVYWTPTTGLLQTIYTCLISFNPHKNPTCPVLCLVPFNRYVNRSSKRSQDAPLEPHYTWGKMNVNLVAWKPATQLLSLYGPATWAKVGTASPQSQTHWGSMGSLSSPQWRLNPSVPLSSIHTCSPPRSPFLSHPNLAPTASCNDCPSPAEREDTHQAGPCHRMDSIPEHRRKDMQRAKYLPSWAPG